MVVQPAGVEAVLLTSQLPVLVITESRRLDKIDHESFFHRSDLLPKGTDWAGGYFSWYTGRENSGLNLGFRHWLIIGTLSLVNLILWRSGPRHRGHSLSSGRHTAGELPDNSQRQTATDQKEGTAAGPTPVQLPEHG